MFGAGRSAGCLIDYLAAQCKRHHWRLTVADGNLALARDRVLPHEPLATAVEVNVLDEPARRLVVEQADIVISLLPPALHYLLAGDCLLAGKNLLTASYLDDDMRQLAPEIRRRGLLFLCEMGLDPGIDHMSALQLIRRIEHMGGKIVDFYSHCGGLVAPESDDNPWHYKISWNPKNVVMAGKAGATYRWQGKTVTLPYEQLFDAHRLVAFPKLGKLAWYPNRDSLPYMDVYALQHCRNFVRTTLRHPTFCAGWSRLVALGLTDDQTVFDTTTMRFTDWLQWHQQLHPTLAPATPVQEELFEYLGLYSESVIGWGKQTAAETLQQLIETKWRLEPADKDMVVMKHELVYQLEGRLRQAESCLMVKGENQWHTAMAKTVGLPLGIAAVLLLSGKLPLVGLYRPVVPEIYEPVLYALAKEGIVFDEQPG